LERLFLEERRRTKTIPHAFGERTVLKLMFAAILRASQSWLRIRINDFERKQLQTLREELEQQFRERNTVSLKPASHSKNYSK
jgi:putative transposase